MTRHLVYVLSFLLAYHVEGLLEEEVSPLVNVLGKPEGHVKRDFRNDSLQQNKTNDVDFSKVVKYEFLKMVTYMEAKTKRLYHLKTELKAFKLMLLADPGNETVAERTRDLQTAARRCIQYLLHHRNRESTTMERDAIVANIANDAIAFYTKITNTTARASLKKKAVSLLRHSMQGFRKLSHEHFSVLKRQVVSLVEDIQRLLLPTRKELKKVYTEFQILKSLAVF